LLIHESARLPDALFADRIAEGRGRIVRLGDIELGLQALGQDRLVDDGGQTGGQQGGGALPNGLPGQLKKAFKAFFNRTGVHRGDDKVARCGGAQKLVGGFGGAQFADEDIAWVPAQAALEHEAPLVVFLDLGLIAEAVFVVTAFKVVFDGVFDGEGDAAQRVEVIGEQRAGSGCFALAC